MKKVLICGDRSFVAAGLTDKLDVLGIDYDCFSRGEKGRVGNRIEGDVLQMSSNDNLNKYDTVINFIVLKDQSIDANIAYVAELLKFCEVRNVKHLIHISSISVYPNSAKYINELSEIEKDPAMKGGYAGVKVAVDQYLLQQSIEGMHISFVRPGFIYEKSREVSKEGIIKSIGNINILIGNKKTALPLINKTLLQDALVKIVCSHAYKDVYLILNNDSDGTKFNFARNQWGGRMVSLPAFPFIISGRILKNLKIINSGTFSKIVGVFKTTKFDSEQTEKILGLSFSRKKFCVIGAGAYGSYICNALSQTFPHEEIVLFEVGNGAVKNESEIGYLSKITSKYTGLQKGRYFGLGGASAKWGGQLFTFTINDFENPTGFLKDIVAVNEKWRDKVFTRFNLKSDFKETRISQSLFIKTGVWLGYFNRNLYKYFRIGKKTQVSVLTDRRVVKLNTDENKHITSVEYISQNGRKQGVFDHYFLCTGAFETARLLLESELVTGGTLPFSDHLSQRVFKIRSGTQIGNRDNFMFKVSGTSLITKRIVGEVDGVSFFCHPIYNSDFPFFQNFKKLLFGHAFSLDLIMNIIRDIPSCLGFAWSFFVKKQMYVYNNEFYFQIDIENPFDSGEIKLINEKDQFGERGVGVDFNVDQKTDDLFRKSKMMIREYLDANNVEYEELNEETKIEKYEDTYHPFGIYSNFDSMQAYFNSFDNLLITNTGILPRAGGINSTCAVMPLIEEYIVEKL